MNKIKNRYELAKSYLCKKVRVSGFPRVIGIELTNRCNLKCIMCARQQMSRNLGDMDFELFKKIIDEGKEYLEFVWLQDLGEPFLHKDIFSMIEYCREKGIRTGISTNATIMNQDIIDGIAVSGLDYLMFGFDGASKQTYERVRLGACYEEVVNNIKKFIKTKLSKDLKTFLVIQCIYMQETEREIESFRNLWNIKGVDALRIRQITYSADKAAARFINRKRCWPCFWPWSNPHIKWDGVVVPCCQDINADYALGNLNQFSLKELWNNEKMQELRKLLIFGKYEHSLICKKCNMFQPTILQVLSSSFIDQFILNKLIPYMESLICKMRY
ncbi:MAG: radical SAM protein [Candidatus Omnitrophota bacterium]|nr:radical SAM protein [Candidatus Omnitrophota bacterium]